jgi:carboxylesterase
VESGDRSLDSAVLTGSRLHPLAALGAAALAALLTRRRIARYFEEDVARRLPLGGDGIVRGAAPIVLEAGTTHAALLLHGFNDTPQSLAPLARFLHRHGWTVHVPLLPTHGRSLRDAARASAEEWLTFAREQYEQLAERHEQVAVCGQSMGGALAVLLAAKHQRIPALVLLAPYLGMPHLLKLKLVGAWVAQLVTPYRRHSGGERSIHDPVARAEALGTGVVTARMIEQLRRISRKAAQVLPRVTAPTLYLQSREDNRISPADAERHFHRLGSPIREQRWLTGCGHILATDFCREEVARQVHEWCTAHAGPPRPRNRGDAGPPRDVNPADAAAIDAAG